MDDLEGAQKTSFVRESHRLQKLRMTVYPMSDVEHNQQILAGLEILRSKGEIDFSYRFDGPSQFGFKRALIRGDASASCVIACLIEEIGYVAFDLSDGDVVAEPIYEKCFRYFKRSYSHRVHGSRDRIYPLGLNYEARSPITSFGSALARAIGLYRNPRTTGRAICRAMHLSYPPILDAKVAQSLTLSQEPRILFVARAYDPQVHGSTPEERSEIEALNNMRADCVVTLQREFGDIFTGGLIADRYALEHFSGCVVPPSFPTNRRSFLGLIERHHICVATTGLFDSIGWKFAEYLAKGRSVVSEPLRFSVPGPLHDGVNYLSFTTAAECVERCRVLRADPMMLRGMMIANRAYYLGYVEPEAIVRNALQVVLAA